MKRSVIIVSNRLPVSVKKSGDKLKFYPSVGGLATGLASYVTDKHNRWIGWPGIASDDLTNAQKEEIVAELAQHNCYPVFLSQKQLDNYYSGYSNSVLWPLFHDLPLNSEATQNENFWRAYRSVNAAFADVVMSLSRPHTTIWVHDYQLLLLPALIRAQRPKDYIGFFLHIPFPSAKAFSSLPNSKALLSGMLGSNLVGFHTESYVKDFLESCQQQNIGIVSSEQVIFGDRTVRVADFPMGIDYDKFSSTSGLKSVKRDVAKLRRKYKDRKIILTVDRLEPSKGLLERLHAYEQFLAQNLDQHSKVVMVMIVVPSRTEIEAYQQLKDDIDKLVKDINQTYGVKGWRPVDYLYKALPFEDLAPYYQAADIAFITPLRDGMNLVAKEFIASKPKRDGVLILSETAGAAQELTDAILVNPNEPSSLTDALTSALTMTPRELKNRLKHMQDQISTKNVHHWARSFMKTLEKPIPLSDSLGVKITRSLNDTRQAELINKFNTSKHRLILLDYDGVLSPFVTNPQKAAPTKQLLSTLWRLAQKPHTEIVIVSGRSREDLETWFASLPVSLVAEHGALIRRKHHKLWHETTGVDSHWKRLIMPALNKYALKTPGATVEEKAYSLVWHYRGANEYYAQKHIVVLKRGLRPLMRSLGLSLQHGNKIIEIRPSDVSKGHAVQAWLEQNPEFILVIGDDKTDEDMFDSLPPEADSIKVGRGRTAARWRLKSVNQVHQLLKHLAR
jgi:trehalose 6-phosphate synthase/phosphatase